MAEGTTYVDVDVYVPRPDSQDRWSAWKQPFLDLRQPTRGSDWLRQVAHQRVLVYDRIRQFLTRLALLAVIAGCLMALEPGVRWWAWVLLLPGLVQGVSEIVLEKPVRRELVLFARRSTRAGDAAVAPDGDERPNVAVRWWIRVYSKLPLNFTGVLGGVAVLCILVAVSYGTTSSEASGWVKIAAFVAALLYLNSAASGPLLESTVYEEGNSGPFLRAIRPFVWPVLGVVAAAAFVAPSAAAGLWSASSLPYAYLSCGLTYALGWRIREHDRVANASGRLVRTAHEQANDRFRVQLHRLTSPMFHGLSARVLERSALDPADHLALRTFLDDMQQVHRRSRDAAGFDLQTTLLPSIASVVRRCCQPYGIRPDLRLDLVVHDPTRAPEPGAGPVVTQETMAFVKDLLVVLVENAGQAYSANPVATDPLLQVTATVEGGDVLVRVRDALPPISRDAFAAPGGILHTFARLLAARGGALGQEVEADGGKTIHARWPNSAPDLRATDLERI